MDLLAQLIPIICQRFGKSIKFIIGGDGPKKVDLEQMKENFRIQDQVEFVGSVSTKDTPSLLQKGDIFLNCSLTEAFCMAIVEACCCGLLVVSTNVGGIPEVLPKDLLRLADPNVNSLCDALTTAIIDMRKGLDVSYFHDTVKHMYSWEDVARRTDLVYEQVMSHQQVPLIEVLKRCYGCGEIAGKLSCLLILLCVFYRALLEWLMPDIDESFYCCLNNKEANVSKSVKLN